MKSKLSLILVLSLVTVMYGCGKDGGSAPSSSSTSTTSSTSDLNSTKSTVTITAEQSKLLAKYNVQPTANSSFVGQWDYEVEENVFINIVINSDGSAKITFKGGVANELLVKNENGEFFLTNTDEGIIVRVRMDKSVIIIME